MSSQNVTVVQSSCFQGDYLVYLICIAHLWQPPRHAAGAAAAAAAALLSTSYNCTAEWTHPSKSHASLHTFAQRFH